MNVSEALKSAGYKPEKSSVGDKFIFNGIYRASLFDVAAMEDKGYGPSVYAQFKIQETLAGDESRSQYPEFKGYFNTAPDKIANKRSGLVKLLNGLFSAGTDVNVEVENIIEELEKHKGAEVFISAYTQEPRKQVNGEWIDDPDGENKQAFAFMTKANAEKKAAKAKDAKPF